MRRPTSLLAAAALLVGVLGATPTSALAATPSDGTSLALTRFYQMAASEDRLFVSGGPSQSSVVVLAFDGSIDTTLDNIPGASGLAIHDSILYVAAFGALRIERFDLTTQPPTKLSSLSTAPLIEPVDVVVAGGKLWFTSHCDQWGTSIASMELDGSNVTVSDPSGFEDWSYCGGIIGSPFAPNRLFAQGRGISPTYLYEYNVKSGSMVLVHQDNWGHGPFSGSDVAVLPDGKHFVMGSLNNVGLGEFQMSDFFGPTFTYSADRWSGVAVATGANGVIAGALGGPYEKEVWVWEAGVATAKAVYDFPEGSANEMWWQGLEFSPDGSRLFAASGAYDDQVVIHVLDPSLSSASLTLDASVSTLTYGTSTTLAAHLAGGGGGAQLQIFATPAGGSKSLIAEGTADANGDLSVRAQPRVNTTYVAEFAGDASTSPATSERVDVNVRALVRGRMLKFYGSRDGYKLYRAAQDVYYAAEVLPHKIGKRLRIEFQYRSGGRWRSAGDQAFEIRRDGLVVIAFQGGSLPQGRYRLQSRYGGDASNLPGISEWSGFEVTGRTSRLAARSAPAIDGFPGTPVA